MVVALSLAAAAAQAQVVSGSSSDASAPDYTVHPGDTMMGGHVVIPQSSIENPGDVGLRAHTNTRIFVPQRGTQAQPGIPAGAGVVPPPNSATVQPVAGLFAETPASLACVYAQVTPTAGCNASTLTTNATGGAGRVVIVDAYDDPSAVADLQAYSTQFGLPPPILSVIYASGTQPAGNIGWAQEESLDLDMVHAMAPGAQIVLVEAASNSFTDLFQAEDVATAAAAATEGEVTNSWGGGEFLGETSYDTHFAGAKVVYFASTGDAPGVEFPSVSPNVVAAGGTSLARNLDATLSYRLDTSWVDGGGGPSAYYARPSYQNALAARIGANRSVPDIAFDANPITGVWVYCSTGCGNTGTTDWMIFGGTSVASPALAGIVNAASSFLASSSAELTKIYSNLGNSNFTTVEYGTCGPRVAYLTRIPTPSNPGLQYNACAGLGTPFGRGGL